MTREIPPKPTNQTESGWLVWVDSNFPFDKQWQRFLLRRGPSERPEFGTYESLEDLRGIEDRMQAAVLAAHWWNTRENMERVLGYAAAKQRDEAQVERKRLILLAKQALDGKLGETAQERDDARSMAQSMVKQAPEYCSDDDLSDWLKMHQYSKKLAKGWRGERPKLAADVRREADQRRSLRDLDRAIDATPAGRPRAVPQREMFG